MTSSHDPVPRRGAASVCAIHQTEMVYAPADAAHMKSMRLDHAWTVDRWTLT
jgi:hypothetical protein